MRQLTALSRTEERRPPGVGLLFAALLSNAAFGCTELTAAGAGVRESQGRGLEACDYLGEFVGRASDPHDAKIDALNAAGAGGATVVVWDEDGAPSWPTRGTYVSAKGYRCP